MLSADMRFSEVHKVMVNVDRVKEKLPGLLADAKTTKHKAWNEFMRNRYRLRKLNGSEPSAVQQPDSATLQHP
jgi:hypothetical protein